MTILSLQPMECHVHQFQFFITLLLTTPRAVVLSVLIGLGRFLCPIYSSECHAGMDSLKFMYRDPSLASAAEDIIVFMICAL